MNEKDVVVVIDLETTGLNFNEDVIEITAKAINGEDEFVIYNHLTKPTKSIPAQITDLTGITNEMVADKQDFRNVFCAISQFVNEITDAGNNVYIVAHNANFEFKFLAHYMTQHAFRKIKWLCTRANMMVDKFGEIDKYQRGTKLVNAAEYYGFEFDETKAHRAEYDVDVTMEVFKKQLEKFTLKEMCDNFKKLQ